MSSLHFRYYAGINQLSRNLRKNMTPQEKLVWKLLRKKKLSGYRFLRQHPIFYREEKNWVDFYIADFYCSKLKLVVEIDGKIHDYRKEYDYERDQKLNEKGIRVVRIKNEETKDKNKLEMNLIDIIAFRASSLATL